MAGVCPYSSALKKLEVSNRDCGQVGASGATISISGLQKSRSEGLEGQCGPVAGTER